jgi:hypothetical protein
MNDLHDNCRTKSVIYPILVGAPEKKMGAVIDRQGYNGIEFIICYGEITEQTNSCTVEIQDGSVTGTLTEVADAYLQGTEALASITAVAKVAGTNSACTKRIGYKGNKRYVTANITSVVSSTGMIGVAALLYNPTNAPVANP